MLSLLSKRLHLTQEGPLAPGRLSAATSERVGKSPWAVIAREPSAPAVI